MNFIHIDESFSKKSIPLHFKIIMCDILSWIWICMYVWIKPLIHVYVPTHSNVAVIRAIDCVINSFQEFLSLKIKFEQNINALIVYFWILLKWSCICSFGIQNMILISYEWFILCRQIFICTYFIYLFFFIFKLLL